MTDKCGEALLATDYHTNGPFSFENPAQLSYTGMLLNGDEAHSLSMLSREVPGSSPGIFNASFIDHVT